MKYFYRVKFILTLTFIISSFVVYGEINTFTGKVKPLITSTIHYGTNDVYRGFIVYAARQGQILHGPTFDIDGKVIKHGDILISLAKDYNKTLLEQAKSDVAIKKANLSYMKIEYDRYQKLAKTNAVSKEVYQNYVSQYFQALSEYNQSVEQLKTREIELDLCDYHVEYDCIVEKTLMPFGLCAGELPVEVISQLDPIGINIKMDRETARKITPATGIAIYPMMSDKPVAPLHYMSILTDDGIILRVRNFAISPKNTDNNGKEIPIVECFDAINLYSNKIVDNIGVPKISIQKDKKGLFVWKGIGVNTCSTTKGVPPIFPVKKVYVNIGKISRYCGNYIKYDEVIPIEKNSVIKGDLLVVNPPENLKDNDKVCFYNEVYQFMPGDNVKVEINF